MKNTIYRLFCNWLSSLGLLILVGCGGRIYDPNADGSVQVADFIEPPYQTVELRLDQFRSKDDCSTCHAQQVAEWELSSHSRAMTDPVFQALVQRLEGEQPSSQSNCISCHSNIGMATNSVGSDLLFDQFNDLVMEGVTCESCHKLVAGPLGSSIASELDPSAPLQGPFSPEALAPPHPAQQSFLLTSPELCKGCHDVESESGVSLEQPYEEWKESPARLEDDKQCLDCHMSIVKRSVSSLPGIDDLRPSRSHTFMGAGMLTIDSTLDPRVAEGLALEVTAQLREAASLELDATTSEDRNVLAISLVAENHVKGHRFPTGSVFFRQLWVKLLVEDANGLVLVDLQQPEELKSEDNAATYGHLFLSGQLFNLQDEPTLFPWGIGRLENASLQPGERRPLNLNIPLPSTATGPFQVEASLQFRTYPRELIEALNLSPAKWSVSVELDSVAIVID